MVKKETVKVEGEDVDKELLERFNAAVNSIEENDTRHKIPKFLKEKVDPEKEFKKFRKELKEQTSLFHKKKKTKASKA